MKSQKVFVGLSGGVDSAVSAAILKTAGYDVTGVYIRVWQPDWIECNWREERHDAMRVAAHLNIPFVTIDAVKAYKQGVIDYMIAEYTAGRTPNPDVMCNREVKFGVFWKWAKAQGADYIATGHYAKIEKVGKVQNKKNVGFRMRAGTDRNKDQSYFLWTLNQADLEHVLFPVGHITKPEVRKLAEKFDLPNADKKDSQGLCFIGKIDVKKFLGHYIKQKPGNVLSKNGKIIGRHMGALLLTLGERRGFTITNKTPNDLPYYVVSKNVKKNTITVVQQNKKGIVCQSESNNNSGSTAEISKVNWINQSPKTGITVSIRTRYRQPLIMARIMNINVKTKTAKLKLENITDPITPGQSLVIYKGKECLGGGIIK